VATYTVPSGTSSITETLTASAADTVTFADRARYIAINNTGSTVLYARADGTAATVGGQGCIAVEPNATALLANGGIYWNQSSNVIPTGVNQFGAGNTSSSPSSPGMVQSQRSLRGNQPAGSFPNPGTVVSIISSAADAYTLALAG
jgi:hypothetical protein